jgi:pimeloyl-ACP methyl ester carboxylesterase/DNA-binding CsgD family transcriptional regulator
VPCLALLNDAEPLGHFTAFVPGLPPGQRRQQTWPSTVASLAQLVIHRYAMLGLLDERGFPAAYDATRRDARVPAPKSCNPSHSRPVRARLGRCGGPLKPLSQTNWPHGGAPGHCQRACLPSKAPCSRHIDPGAAARHDNAMPPRQDLHFCTAHDGTRIAVASIGSGPPLLRAAHWLSHVEHDWTSPVWRPWLAELARGHTYIRYDQRGCGLSDTDVGNVSLDDWVSDLEAVADGLGLARFPLLGMSQGGAVAVAYAVRHPERVSRLVLCGAYGRGALARAETEAQRLEARTLVNLVQVGWGRDNPAFRQVFTSQFIPDGSPAQHQWWNELERLTASPQNAARTLDGFQRVDVSGLAGQVRVPTLVMHARGDARVPFDEGRRLASLIPGARFLPLDSRNHVLLDSEPAWPVFLAELRDFLGDPARTTTRLLADGLTPAEQAVLQLLAQGLDNRTIAARLGKREKTVRNQVSSVFDKLGVRTRAEAIVHAREHGVDR